MEIRHAAAALEAGLRKADPDLSIPLLRTLIAVLLKPNISVNELAEAISVPQQSASRYVAILQGRYQSSEGNSFARKPLLSQKPSATDMRRNELALTSQGRSRIENILSHVFVTEILNG